MCINGHHNKLGGSEASMGMAWTPPKRRGRAQRRVSRANSSCGGSWILGYVRRRATELPAKKCCRGTSDLPRGQPNNLFSKSWFDPGGAAKSWFIPPQVLDSTCTDLCLSLVSYLPLALLERIRACFGLSTAQAGPSTPCRRALKSTGISHEATKSRRRPRRSESKRAA